MGKETLQDYMTWLVALHIANDHAMYYESYDGSDATLYERAEELKEYVKDRIECDSWKLLKDDILEHVLDAVDWERVIDDVFGDE